MDKTIITDIGERIRNNDVDGVRKSLTEHPEIAAKSNFGQVAKMLLGLKEKNDALQTFILESGASRVDYELFSDFKKNGISSVEMTKLDELGVPSFAEGIYSIQPSVAAKLSDSLHELEESAKTGDIRKFEEVLSQNPRLLSLDFASDHELSDGGDIAERLHNTLGKNANGYIRVPGMDSIFKTALDNGNDDIARKMASLGYPHTISDMDFSNIDKTRLIAIGKSILQNTEEGGLPSLAIIDKIPELAAENQDAVDASEQPSQEDVGANIRKKRGSHSRQAATRKTP